MSRIVLAMGFALVIAAVPSVAAAQRRVEHERITIPEAVFAFDAGTICDFAYAFELVGGSQLWNSFYDADGNLVRQVVITDLVLRHENLENEAILEETLHFSSHLNLVTGEEVLAGNVWHARTADGKLVVRGAGRYVIDLATGELLETTPNTSAGADAGAALVVNLARGQSPARRTHAPKRPHVTHRGRDVPGAGWRARNPVDGPDLGDGDSHERAHSTGAQRRRSRDSPATLPTSVRRRFRSW
jgi:hypothetical protein